MFCTNCGTKKSEGAAFCSACGASANGTPYPVATPTPILKWKVPEKPPFGLSKLQFKAIMMVLAVIIVALLPLGWVSATEHAGFATTTTRSNPRTFSNTMNTLIDGVEYSFRDWWDNWEAADFRSSMAPIRSMTPIGALYGIGLVGGIFGFAAFAYLLLTGHIKTVLLAKLSSGIVTMTALIYIGFMLIRGSDLERAFFTLMGTSGARTDINVSIWAWLCLLVSGAFFTLAIIYGNELIDKELPV